MTTPPALTIDTRDTEETVTVGKAVGQCCMRGDIIALEGELGAGKTQFVRGLAEGMGLDARQVNSPTFVLVQEYEPAEKAAENGVRPHTLVLVHIDAYRIKSEDDLVSIGWHGEGDELREDAVVAVEWASLIEPALGSDLLWVTITHEQDGRSIALAPRGTWQDKIQVLMQSLQANGLTPTQRAER